MRAQPYLGVSDFTSCVNCPSSWRRNKLWCVSERPSSRSTGHAEWGQFCQLLSSGKTTALDSNRASPLHQLSHRGARQLSGSLPHCGNLQWFQFLALSRVLEFVCTSYWFERVLYTSVTLVTWCVGDTSPCLPDKRHSLGMDCARGWPT